MSYNAIAAIRAVEDELRQKLRRSCRIYWLGGSDKAYLIWDHDELGDGRLRVLYGQNGKAEKPLIDCHRTIIYSVSPKMRQFMAWAQLTQLPEIRP